MTQLLRPGQCLEQRQAGVHTLIRTENSHQGDSNLIHTIDNVCFVKIHPGMGDSEAVLGLDGLKEGLETGEAGQKMRPSVSSCSSRGSQMEVKLPWYMGITCKVGLS